MSARSMAFRRARSDVDMTHGNIFMHILTFALPLLAGNIFQQLYNTVDTWVVGNFVGSEAFSAVGAVGPITSVLIGAFMGLSSGAGVVISQYYGAGQPGRVRDTVHTAIALTLILSVVMSLIGIFMTPTMLRFMNTPEEVFPEAQSYLTIYFAGLSGLLFYNMNSGILRAVGDSRRPFYFLVVAAILNTVLDLFFVIVLKMGVEGVAYATIIAQGVSAILTIITLIRAENCVKLFPKRIRIHWELLKKIVFVGFPAALQMAVTSFSNVFVQSYINFFGSACMGGWTAYAKIDALVLMPIQSLSLSATTFVGQNLGKGQIARARKGVRTALLMCMGCTLVIAAVVMLLAAPLVSFFNSEPEVVRFGTLFLHALTPFYVICCVQEVYVSALRGAGDGRGPMIILLCSYVAFRQIYLFVVSNFISNTVLPVAMGYPAGWVVCCIATAIYYHRANLGSKVVVAKENIPENA